MNFICKINKFILLVFILFVFLDADTDNMAGCMHVDDKCHLLYSKACELFNMVNLGRL